MVTEAKFVDIKNLSNSKKTSKKQLIDTVLRINEALFGEPSRLDRDLWLSKISDLLVEGTIFMQNSTISIEKWRELIRTGKVEIEIKGYSHVFVPTSDGTDTIESEQVKITDIENCYQEVYSRESVRGLILSLLEKKPLFTVRSQFSTEVTWMKFSPSLPSDNQNYEQSQVIETQEVTDHMNRSKNDDTNEGVEESNSSKTEEEQQPIVTKTKLTEESRNGLKGWIVNNINEENHSLSDQEWLTSVVNSLKSALATYNLQGKVLESRLTPNLCYN